jgi:acetyl-CoA carboxylase alpha subunit
MRNSEFHKAPYWLIGMIAETNALRRENERMTEETRLIRKETEKLREQNNKLKKLDVSQLIRKSIKPQYLDLFESFIN